MTTEWGEMMMPGVYMIRRHVGITEPGVDAGANDPLLRPDTVHNDIKEVEKLIKKLKESNEEITKYLEEEMSKGVSSGDSKNTTSSERHLATVDGEVCDELEEFRAAMAENEQIISRKEEELTYLRKLLDLQRCGKALHEEEKRGEEGVAADGGVGAGDHAVEEEEIESPIHIDL